MTDPWPPVMSAVVVAIPEAEPLVGRWRADLDPSAGEGMPAHVTVVAPWLPPDRLHDSELGALAELTAGVPPFRVQFAGFGRFPRTLWLAPEPADPFVRLTLAVERRWPEFPAYGGRFPSLVPHLSIGDAVDPDALGHVVADVAPRLPVVADVSQVLVMVRDGGDWQERARLGLGTAG